MKNGKMQCKDIPTIPILTLLWWLDYKKEYTWGNCCFEDDADVRRVMPEGLATPNNLVHAKMRTLINNGLVDGCPCGCRGDFVLTCKGRDRVEKLIAGSTELIDYVNKMPNKQEEHKGEESTWTVK